VHPAVDSRDLGRRTGRQGIKALIHATDPQLEGAAFELARVRALRFETGRLHIELSPNIGGIKQTDAPEKPPRSGVSYSIFELNAVQ